MLHIDLDQRQLKQTQQIKAHAHIQKGQKKNMVKSRHKKAIMALGQIKACLKALCNHKSKGDFSSRKKGENESHDQFFTFWFFSFYGFEAALLHWVGDRLLKDEARLPNASVNAPYIFSLGYSSSKSAVLGLLLCLQFS